MKKFILAFAMMCTATIFAGAQWKVVSVEKSEPDTRLLQVIETPTTTIVYATMDKNCTETHMCSLNRGICVKANGLKYKVVNSVNLPLTDEAEPRYAYLTEGENEINFVMEFEKFPVENGFDIIESSNDGPFCFNFKGVTVAPMDEAQAIDTDRFLDSASPVIMGKYAYEGSYYLYYIRNGVCVTCNAVKQPGATLLMKADELFYLDIVNDSDHGVMFDFDKITVVGSKNKADGDSKSDEWYKYNSESYDSYLELIDYDEARYKTSGALEILGSELSTQTNMAELGSWKRLGFAAATALNEKAIENRVEEYMKEHPKDRPAGLRTTSIRSGEAIHGYVAAKRKKADEVEITIPMDGYSFSFTFTL